MSEIERIKKAYEKRKREQRYKLYSYFNTANLFTIHQREKALLRTLKRFKCLELSDKKILDVGCGSGGVLRDFIKYGAIPENLYGIDLLSDRIERAKRLSPHINFYLGSATDLPFENEFFDIVMQFTVFTSILDYSMKQKIAQEMLRVLKPAGIIIWYDYHMNNPENTDVRGVRKQEIFALFPNCSIQLKRVTLAPPLARLIAPYSWLVCNLLEKIPVLCTHYLGVIRKQLG